MNSYVVAYLTRSVSNSSLTLTFIPNLQNKTFYDICEQLIQDYPGWNFKVRAVSREEFEKCLMS